MCLMYCLGWKFEAKDAWKYSCPIEKGSIQKGRQRSSLLVKGVVVWYGVNRMIIVLFKASIPPSSHYSIHPFLQIILVQNS